MGQTTAREYSFHAFIARGDSFAAGDIAGTSSEGAHARAAELWGCDVALIDSHPSTECRHRGCAGRTRDGR